MRCQSHVWILIYFINKFVFLFLILVNQIFYDNKGVFIDNRPLIEESTTREYAFDKSYYLLSKNNVVNEVLEKIKRRTEISREETEQVPNYKKCLANGVLDFDLAYSADSTLPIIYFSFFVWLSF